MLRIDPASLDIWDPNNWIADDYEYRIYADENDLDIYCVVDAIDYAHCAQWLWSLHSRRRFELKGRLYLRRVVTEFTMPDGPAYESRLSGKIVRNRHRIQYTRMLHTEIMLRTGIEPPTPDHDEVDHIDRDTKNCRRANLQWATRAMQVHNSDVIENMRRARQARWGR